MATFVRNNRPGRFRNEASRRSDGDEMSEPLLTEDGQRRRDAVKNPFDVDVYHLLPFLDAQVVERGDRPTPALLTRTSSLP